MLRYEVGLEHDGTFAVQAMNYQGRFVDEEGRGFERITRIILPEVYTSLDEATKAVAGFNKDLDIVKSIFTNTLGESVFTVS